MASWIPKLNRLWKQEGNSERSAAKRSSESSDDAAGKAAESDDERTNDSAKATAEESEAASNDTAEKTAESDDEHADDSAEKVIEERESASEVAKSAAQSTEIQMGPLSRSDSAPPPPASLPPPIISAAADSLAKSRGSLASKIPSLASKPPRKNGVPPIPVTRSSLSENPPSINIVGQADLERLKQESLTRFTELKKALEARDQRIRELEVALEKERRERSKAIEERDHRILSIENGLKEEQDSWTSQVEERDEALFDLKLEMQTEYNRLADRVDNQNKLVQTIETAVNELREKIEKLQRNIGESRISEIAVGDDLTRIKGVGPRFERALKNQGVTTYEQIASWTKEDIDRIASQIRIRPERIQRERWVEGARELIPSSR